MPTRNSPAAERLGQQREERPPLDLLAHQPHADEDRDQGAEDVHRGQAEVLDDLLVLADREAARAAGPRASSGSRRRRGCRARARGWSRGTCWPPPPATRFSRSHAPPASPPAPSRVTKNSSSDCRTGWTESTRPPASCTACTDARPGPPRGPRAASARPVPRCAIAGPSARPARRGQAAHQHLHVRDVERQDLVEPAGRHHCAAAQQRDAVAQRLGVGEDVRREEDRLARVLELQDEPRTRWRPIGSRPDIGSSRITSSGSLMSACARPDALQHALRDAAQRDVGRARQAHALEQLAPPGSGARRRGSPNSRPTYSRYSRASGSRRGTGSPAGSRRGSATRGRRGAARAPVRCPRRGAAGPSGS